jgi:hypothetical protein
MTCSRPLPCTGRYMAGKLHCTVPSVTCWSFEATAAHWSPLLCILCAQVQSITGAGALRLQLDPLRLCRTSGGRSIDLPAALASGSAVEQSTGPQWLLAADKEFLQVCRCNRSIMGYFLAVRNVSGLRPLWRCWDR